MEIKFPTGIFPLFVSEENFWGLVTRVSFLLSADQQCQSTEGNTNHWPQPEAWPCLAMLPCTTEVIDKCIYLLTRAISERPELSSS